MKILNFFVKWDKEKEKTWSGNPYSLMCALKKLYIVNDYNISLNIIEKKIKKIFHIFFYLKEKNRTFNRLVYYLDSNKVKKILMRNNILNNDTKIFIAGDFAEITHGGYIYIDFSIDSLLYLKEKHPGLFKYSGYLNTSCDDFSWRKDIQIRNIEKLDGVFVMGKWLADLMVKHSHFPIEKIHHVGGGINIEFTKIDYTKKSGNKILFVGRTFENKGCDLVIDAFKLLHERNHNVELYIIGLKENPYKTKIDGVSFIGFVPHSDLFYYYNMCDVFCMPSRFEGYGFVFIEALAFGLPCIGRNAFAMPEFIENNETGFLIENEDANELAYLMNELIIDKKYSDNVKKRKDYYINHYSWDAVARRMSDVIEKK